MGYEGECVKEYLEKFPETPSLTLAKMMFRNDPALFISVETARNRVRYYRGQFGKFNRSKLLDTTHVKDVGSRSPFENLPESIVSFDDWEPYNILGKNILVLADAHIPYHVAKVLRIALERGKSEEIDTILLLGDFADIYALSRWEKDPRERDFIAERIKVIDTLTIMRDAFPDVEIIYKLGNHDERYERYIKVKAPELYGIGIFNFAHLIEASKNGIKIVEDQRIVRVGKLNCIHGHEFKGGSTIAPARWLLLKGKEMALCAHFHKTDSSTTRSMEDKVVSTWSVGCLSDLHPRWLRMNDWNHGFAIVQRTNDRDFQLSNYKIIDGKVFAG